MASHNVHANPKGVLFKLGLVGDPNILLARPSNAGLTDPGHAAALFLLQISSSLLSLNSTADYIVTIKMMQTLADEIGEGLITAHKRLEEERSQPDLPASRPWEARPTDRNSPAELKIAIPSGQAAERMNVPAQLDVVLLHVIGFHGSKRVVGAVLSCSVEVDKILKLRWMPIDAVSAEYEATIAR